MRVSWSLRNHFRPQQLHQRMACSSSQKSNGRGTLIDWGYCEFCPQLFRYRIARTNQNDPVLESERAPMTILSSILKKPYDQYNYYVRTNIQDVLNVVSS